MLADFPTAQDPWVAPDPMLAPVREGSRFLAPVGRIDHFTGRWRKLRDQAPQALVELRTVAMIQSAGASTRIEGAQVSDAEVKAILSGLSIDSFRARDAGEVRGYDDLQRLIGEQYAELAITENNLKEFHRILLAQSAKDACHRDVICANARSEPRSLIPKEFTRTKISATSSYESDLSRTCITYG